MRPALKQFEQVEAYVRGTLTDAEREAFDAQLADSQELQELVQFQEIAIAAVKRKALRAEILAATQTGGTGFSGMSTWIIIAFIISVVIGGSIYWIGNIGNTADNDELYLHNTPISSIDFQQEENRNEKSNETEGSTSAENSSVAEGNSVDHALELPFTENNNDLIPWIPFDKQQFKVDTEIGGTLEGKEGTLIIVPSDAFTDKHGNSISGTIDMEVVEALEWSDMLAYNLTTTNDDKALSTGGMVYMQPYKEGEKVFFNENRPVYLEIPTEEVVPEMMAWQGMTSDGNINWRSPRELVRFLTIIDLELLDFIPAGFLEEVEGELPFRGHTEISSNLVDSVYYSLTQSNTSTIEEMALQQDSAEVMGDFSTISSNKTAYKWGRAKRNKRKSKKDQVEMDTEDLKQPDDCSYCFIDPLSIKAIRTNKFQKTFIATKEFETRLQVMHQLPNGQEVLEIYLSHLDENMSVSDKLAFRLVDEEFREIFQSFIDQRATNVDAKIYQSQLSAFYNKKRKSYLKEVEKNRARYQKESTARLKELQSELSTLTKSQSTNVDDAFKSLPVTKSVGLSPPVSSVANMNTYATTWYKTGWINIDKYLHLLEKGEPTEVWVSTESTKPEMRIYQCINPLRTIVPLELSSGRGKALFPDQSQSVSSAVKQTYCLALSQSSEGLFYAEKKYNPYLTNEVALKWEKIDQNALYKRLSALSPRNNASLLKSLKEEEKRIALALKIKEKQQELKTEQERLLEIEEKENAFRSRLLNYLNQCSIPQTSTNAISPSKMRVVTPDAESNNTFFLRLGKISPVGFTALIKNANGRTVYETSNPYFNWNCSDFEESPCPSGVYTCTYSTKGKSKTVTFQIQRESALQIAPPKRQSKNDQNRR